MLNQTGDQSSLALAQRQHPYLIDLSLDRIRKLLDALGRPQDRLARVIHVAGTNGKGSTIAFLQAMFLASGKRVHAYTSPHLVRFNERIQLAQTDGATRAITDSELDDVLKRVMTVNGDDPMTFFEITTAAALLAFAETPADVVLLEVGLGGRLDATNLIDRPAVSVITPISIDHADRLGGTLEQIAFEKAGILKTDIPAVIAPQPPEAMSSIQQSADRIGSRLIRHGEHYDAFEEGGRLVFQDQQHLLDLPLPALIGRNQIVNAGVAVATVLEFSGGRFAASAIEDGLRAAQWPARFSMLVGEPFDDWHDEGTELWLDGGHNPAAAQSLAQTLADLEERAPKPTYLVVGMMQHKDPLGFFAAFKGLVRAVRTVPIAGQVNAMPAEELAEAARQAGLEAEAIGDPCAAVQAIDMSDGSAKRVLICGSLYLAGNILGQAAELRS
ncbi:MAG: bifunctional folylpolyglutamate synthase/dihydrofolate synthase [Hyphomicrobiaceae bacterium]